MVSKRHAKANNPLCSSTDYNPDKENNYIMYYDANKLYGSAMRQPLPYSDFKWLSGKVGKRQKGKGWILEMDLEYPKELYAKHNDYPLAPEKLSIKEEWLSPYQTELLENKNMKNISKLVPNLIDRKKYVVHHRNLQLYLSFGIKLKKVNRILELNKKKNLGWNLTSVKTQSCKIGQSLHLKKDFYKLMNNFVFGKTMENIRKRVDIKL